MGGRALASAVLTLALVLVATSCGDDRGREAAEMNRPARTDQSAPPDGFVAQAKAICTAADEGLPSDVSDAPTAQQRLEVAMDVWSTVVGQLRALEPPGGDEARLDRMLTHFENAIRAGRRAATVNDETALALFAGLFDQASRGAVIAESYGLGACSPIPPMPPAEQLAENEAYQEAMLEFIREVEQNGPSLKMQP